MGVPHGISKRRRRNIGVSPVARSLLFSPKKNKDWWPLLRMQLLAYRLPTPTAEFRFHPVRRWRFDFAWPDQKIALEVEGGIFVMGRHSRGAGMEADMEKYAAALVSGWKVLRISPKHLTTGQGVAWLGRLLTPLPLPHPAKDRLS